MNEIEIKVKEMKEEGVVKTFLNFDKMITPTIIKALFVIGLVISVLVSLGIIMTGLFTPYGGGFQVFIGIILLVVSPILVRLQCELLIIIFKIHEALVSKE